MKANQLILVVDPMCSWCWGFHPIITTLREHHSQDFHISVRMGGLRTTGQMSWDASSRSYLASTWQAVQQQTNQPFNTALLQKETFDYNTYPACKAVITIRELWGMDTAFEYLAAIQEAFYLHAEDITQEHTLLKYVPKEKEKFHHFYHSQRATLLMEHDFAQARSMGANAFPSVIHIDNDGHMVCLKGYRSLEEILLLR